MLWVLATVAAFFVKGLCGFANTLVFTSILGFGESNASISPVELLLGYPSNIILVWKNRRMLNGTVIVPLSLIIVLTSIIGAVLLKNTRVSYLKIIFGIAVMCIALEMHFRARSAPVALRGNPHLFALVGALSGLLCGLFGVGALLAAYISRVSETSGAFKANICAVFLVENTVRLIVYALLGIISFASLQKAALLVPCMLLALFAGIQSAKILNENSIKKLVTLLLFVSGAALSKKRVFYRRNTHKTAVFRGKHGARAIFLLFFLKNRAAGQKNKRKMRITRALPQKYSCFLRQTV